MVRCPFCDSEDIQIEGTFFFEPNQPNIPRHIDLGDFEDWEAYCIECGRDWFLYRNDVKEVETLLEGAKVHV